jgi:hypothetical protein
LTALPLIREGLFTMKKETRFGSDLIGTEREPARYLRQQPKSMEDIPFVEEIRFDWLSYLAALIYILIGVVVGFSWEIIISWISFLT